MHEEAIDVATIAGLYAGLEQEAQATLARNGIGADRIRLLREADIRYAGQSMEVRVQAPGGPIDQAFVGATIEAFHAAHLRTFGYNYAGQQRVEIVNLCVSGFGLIERPGVPKLDATAGPAPAPRAIRPVYFAGAFRDTPVFDRVALGPGYRLDGPAIVEEFGSTSVVLPGQFLIVDPHGILIIRREPNR
jgi:N-methylhydantoinase A